MSKPPLLVHLLLHPESEPARELARHIHRQLNEDVVVPGLRVPTAFCPVGDGSRPPADCRSDLADRSFMVRWPKRAPFTPDMRPLYEERGQDWWNYPDMVQLLRKQGVVGINPLLTEGEHRELFETIDPVRMIELVLLGLDKPGRTRRFDVSFDSGGIDRTEIGLQFHWRITGYMVPNPVRTTLRRGVILGITQSTFR